MATNIESMFNNMMDDENDQPMDVEIDIVNPDAVILDDGSMEITLVPGLEDGDIASAPHNANLAEYLDERDLAMISSELREGIEADVMSREEWVKTYIKGLEVLGLEYEERSQPWDGACGVHNSVLAESAIRFQAETMSETFPAAGPVKTKILGQETKEKREAAERVKADMNYQLTEEMTEYRHEHERMLYALGLSGSAFKKVYFDESMQRQVAPYIPAEDVLVPYGASNIETADRVTHVMRKTKNELKRLQAAGFYVDEPLPEPDPFHSDVEEKKAEQDGYDLSDDDRYCLYECHANLVIEGLPEAEDGIACPYVVTIERSSNKVIGLRRNWREEDSLRRKRQHFVHYVYVPGFGFYGLGLIHIVGGYAKAGTSLIRQLIDAGTLSNLQAGFKTRGMRITGSDEPLEPGEWRDVDVTSGSIRDNLFAIPYKEPSQTLLALLQQVVQDGRRMGAISDMNISDMSANAPVGTTLAIIERVLKPMSAVQARVHFAMKQEFKLLKEIMAENAPENYEFIPARGEVNAKRDDYAMVDIIPVSDPNASTMAQRVVQYQTAMQMAQAAPEIYDLPYLHRQMLDVLGVKNAEKIVPLDEDAVPKDPVSENMDALTGTPLKAFLYQDHEAHIATHTAILQDPMLMQMIGQNPQAQQIMASLQAHITEHLAYSYRGKIEQEMGVSLPEPGQPMPEEIEVALSRLLSRASQKLQQKNAQMAAQQQAQQQQQDPVFQLKQAEMQLKQAEQQRKQAKDAMEAQIKAREHQFKEEQLRVDAVTKTKELELEERELQIKAQKDDADRAAKRRLDSNKIDMELMKLIKDEQNRNVDRAMQEQQSQQNNPQNREDN